MKSDAGTVRLARDILRSSRSASLATLADGAPFASLVTPATSCGLDLLMLVSGLSRHARHLRSDPRCALLVAGSSEMAGSSGAANPQTIPRLTVTGTAEPVPPDDPHGSLLRDRWVRIHPYGALYAGFGDFTLWRLRPQAIHMVAGFGRTHALDGRMVQPDIDLAEQEAPLLQTARARWPEAEIVAIDADGYDTGPAPSPDPDGTAVTQRIAFDQPIASPDAALAALDDILSKDGATRAG
ncbi:HugZ family protein [Lichenicoccus sp.]|uniref:HugZ family pyridoxamine 5'-phosphate oxidase n=1 Tax=Lichenicoccus sp. TaxID=2781899 RepID=UPI003D1273F8